MLIQPVGMPVEVQFWQAITTPIPSSAPSVAGSPSIDTAQSSDDVFRGNLAAYQNGGQTAYLAHVLNVQLDRSELLLSIADFSWFAMDQVAALNTAMGGHD
jgi:hypothetical protein